MLDPLDELDDIVNSLLDTTTVKKRMGRPPLNLSAEEVAIKKEKRRQYLIDYSKKNKDLITAKRKLKYKEHKQRRYEKTKEYRKNNREKMRQSHRDYRAKNREKVRAQANARYHKNKEAMYIKSKCHKYGLSESEVKVLLLNNPGCNICGMLFNNSRHGEAHFDHCHHTHVVRGLLCRHCNCALGLLRDDPELARKAADYLIRHGK